MENGHAGNGIYSETDIIETTDEEGQVHIFEKVSELEIEGKEYALLIYKGNEYEEKPDAPAAEGKDEGYDEEVVVMRISYEDGQEVYEAIEDEAEFERVVTYIENMEDDDDDEDGVTIDVSDFLAKLEDEDESKN